MLLLCLAFSLFTGAFGLVLGLLGKRWGDGAVLLAPFPWVALEILRSHTLLSFPWCLLGYTQYENLPLIQIAPVAAVYGVSFLVLSSSAVCAYSILVPSRRWPLALFALLVAGLYLQGTLALRGTPPSSGSLRVGLVQGDIPQESKWDQGKEMANTERHLALTRQAARGGAELVVWPESALPFYFDTTPEVAERLRDLTRSLGISLLFGNDDAGIDEGGRERFFVGAKMLDPDGSLRLRYHKIHLVPFGEYVPWKSFLGAVGVGKLVLQVSDFTPGEGPSVGRIKGHALGTFICYEAIFPDLVRGFPKAEAELLVNITNDGWYGRTSAPYQHFAMAVFRAVENRKYLLRAANTGITAVVDPFGRVSRRPALFEPAVVVEDVRFVPGTTFYSRHGDVFAWGCLAVAALLVFEAKARDVMMRVWGG
jgi:apolipoprotein N-acyltransferase